jgi:hypothetical protein
LAAKKSRDARRVRENQLKIKVICMENANRMLRQDLTVDRQLIGSQGQFVWI